MSCFGASSRCAQCRRSSIESALSLIPSAETSAPRSRFDPAPTITSGVEFIDNAVNPLRWEILLPRRWQASTPLYVWTEIAGWVWLIGLGAMPSMRS